MGRVPGTGNKFASRQAFGYYTRSSVEGAPALQQLSMGAERLNPGIQSEMLTMPRLLGERRGRTGPRPDIYTQTDSAPDRTLTFHVMSLPLLQQRVVQYVHRSVHETHFRGIVIRGTLHF